MTYVDTSALGKLLILEAETIALQASLQELPDRLASSELTIAELSRAVLRARGSAESAGALLAQLDLLALDRATLERAGRLPSASGTSLRTADAIHLAAAMDLGETHFLTYDRRQAQAAAERGFQILSPGRPADWYVSHSA